MAFSSKRSAQGGLAERNPPLAHEERRVTPLANPRYRHYNRIIGRLPFSSRGTFTRASPSSTTWRPTLQRQVRRARDFSGTSSATVTITVTVSPIFTGPCGYFTTCHHARLYAGHPRLYVEERKTWMAGTSPAMTACEANVARLERSESRERRSSRKISKGVGRISAA
jgi:hypothetical protein